MRWLLSGALRLVPSSWRETVRADLEEEAQTVRRAGLRRELWCLWQTLRLGAALRISLTKDAVASDTRYACRSMVHARWFTVGAALTFGVGIGVNVGVFSAVDRMLFRGLPYAEPDRLYVMKEISERDGQTYGTLPAEWVVEARRLSHGIDELALGDLWTGNFSLVPNPSGVIQPPLALSSATFNMVSLCGTSPILGRSFQEADARERRRVVLLSYGAWQQRYRGSAAVLESQLWQGQQRFDIVGVMPKGFIPPGSVLLAKWDGFVLNDELMQSAGPQDRSVPPVVRLARGHQPEQVKKELNAIVQNLTRGASRTTSVQLVPLRSVLFGLDAPYLWLLVSAAGLVLILTCVNLAGLLISRGRARERHVAMSLALGASPARIIRVALMETLLVSAAGAAVAFVVLGWTANGLAAMLPPLFSNYSASLRDVRVVGFALTLTTLTAIAAGLLPAVRSSRVDVLATLRRAQHARFGGLRGAALLLVVECAVGVILVAGAVITARSLVGLFRADLGFTSELLHPVRVMFPPDLLEDTPARYRKYRAVLTVLRGLPHVTAAGAATVSPLSRARSAPFGNGFEGRGQRWFVTGGFFEAMGMRLIAGRPITDADSRRPSSVAVLSERGVRMVWPGVDPAQAIGRVLRLDGEEPREIVGIVPDIRASYADELEPSIYVPASATGFRFFMYVARTQGSGGIDSPLLRKRISQEIGNPLEAVVGDHGASLWNATLHDRFRAGLFGVFGCAALLLAAVGLYATTSCEVGARRAEIAVRVALGATSNDVRRLILGHAIRPALIGTAIGVFVAFWASRFLQAFVHRVDAQDPATLVLVALLLIGTVIVAALFPSWRASKVDPIKELRVT